MGETTLYGQIIVMLYRMCDNKAKRWAGENTVNVKGEPLCLTLPVMKGDHEMP